MRDPDYGWNRLVCQLSRRNPNFQENIQSGLLHLPGLFLLDLPIQVKVDHPRIGLIYANWKIPKKDRNGFWRIVGNEKISLIVAYLLDFRYFVLGLWLV